MGNISSGDLASVSKVLQGDEAEAARLVEKLQPLVTAIVRRRLPQRTDEADLIQTVYLKVFTNLEQYSGKVPIEHWVSRIAINTCLHQLRHESSRPELRRADLSEKQDEILDLLNHSDEEVSAPQQLAARELVEKLLDRLPPRENMIITMLYLKGHTLQEVQQSTGWSILAVKLLSFRARKKMKKALKHLLQERAL